MENKEQFAQKVLKYLWDDAFKMDRESLFHEDIKSLDDLFDEFDGSTFRGVLEGGILNELGLELKNDATEQEE